MDPEFGRLRSSSYRIKDVPNAPNTAGLRPSDFGGVWLVHRDTDVEQLPKKFRSYARRLARSRRIQVVRDMSPNSGRRGGVAFGPYLGQTLLPLGRSSRSRLGAGRTDKGARPSDLPGGRLGRQKTAFEVGTSMLPRSKATSRWPSKSSTSGGDGGTKGLGVAPMTGRGRVAGPNTVRARGLWPPAYAPSATLQRRT